MAQITINIPDDKLDYIVDAICNVRSYNKFTAGLQNPPTKQQYARQMIIRAVKDMVYTYERRQKTDTLDIN